MLGRVGRHAAIFVGFLLVAIVATWPLVRHLDDAFTGPPSGDTGVYVWNVWVFSHELQQGRLPFYTSAIFSGSPDAAPANLSLHNYTTASNVLAWPLIPLIGLVAAFNVVFLFNIALSGYAGYLLARDQHAPPGESLIGGALFALAPVLVARGFGHFSLVAAAPLAIFAVLLRRLGATGDLRYAVALGAVVAWATFSDAYYGVFCLLMAGLTVLAQLVTVERAVDVPVVRIVGLRRTLDVLLVAIGGFTLALALGGGGNVNVLGIHVRAHTLYTPMLLLTVLALARLAITRPLRLALRPRIAPMTLARAAVAAGVVMVLLLAPVLYALGDQVISGNADWSSPLWRSSPRGIDLLGLVLPNPTHAWWGGPMQARLIAWQGTGDAIPEAVGSLSLVALAVMAWAWWRCGWRPSRIRLAVTLFFALLALGPFLHVAGVNTQLPMPWSVLRYVPILGLVRSPGRFAVLASLGLAVLAAQALAHLGRQLSRSTAPPPRAGLRAPRHRAGAGAAHPLLGRNPGDLPDHRPRPAAGGTRPRAAGRLPRRNQLDGQLLGPDPVLPDGARQGDPRRLPVARLAAPPPRRPPRARPERAVHAQRGAWPDRGAGPGGTAPRRRVPATDAPRLRGGRRDPRLVRADRFLDRRVRAHSRGARRSDGAVRAASAFATRPLRPMRPTMFGNTWSAFIRSPQAHTTSTFDTAPKGISRQ